MPTVLRINTARVDREEVPLVHTLAVKVSRGGAPRALPLEEIAARGTSASASIPVAPLLECLRGEGPGPRLSLVLKTTARGRVPWDAGDAPSVVFDVHIDGRIVGTPVVELGEELVVDSYEDAAGRTRRIRFGLVDFQPTAGLDPAERSKAAAIHGAMGTIAVRVCLFWKTHEELVPKQLQDRASGVEKLMHSDGIVPKAKTRDSPFFSTRYNEDVDISSDDSDSDESMDSDSDASTDSETEESEADEQPLPDAEPAAQGPEMECVDRGEISDVIAFFKVYYGRPKPEPVRRVAMPEGVKEEGGMVIID